MELEDVLVMLQKQHRWSHTNNNCSCGWEVDSDGAPYRDQHDKHLAKILTTVAIRPASINAQVVAINGIAEAWEMIPEVRGPARILRITAQRFRETIDQLPEDDQQ